MHLPARVLSPAAEAFRGAMMENAETHLRTHDSDLLGGDGDGVEPTRLKPRRRVSSRKKRR